MLQHILCYVRDFSFQQFVERFVDRPGGKED